MADRVQSLVVDEEEGIRFFLKETLQRAGHVVMTASSGEEALRQLRETAFDLVMLDLMLAGRVDGLRVLEAVRWRWPDTVVIILTAHGSLEPAMAAIREGVEGYLLKPVEPHELRQAVQEAMERRRMLAQSGEARKKGQLLRSGPFRVDLNKHLVTMGGRIRELTPREFTVLVHLMRNSHRVFSPKELVRVVQQYKCETLHEARRIIKWSIQRLRRKVEPAPPALAIF